MDVVIVGFFALLTLVTIALMAYYALRPEQPGPKCPRCLNRVRPTDLSCRACHVRLG